MILSLLVAYLWGLGLWLKFLEVNKHQAVPGGGALRFCPNRLTTNKLNQLLVGSGGSQWTQDGDLGLFTDHLLYHNRHLQERNTYRYITAYFLYSHINVIKIWLMVIYKCT